MAINEKVRCDGCGYELMGLASPGRCPECGQRFDVDTGLGVVRRSALSESNERGDRLVMWFQVGSLAGLAGLSLAIGIWRASVSPNPSSPLAVGVLVAAVLGFGAFVTYHTAGKS